MPRPRNSYQALADQAADKYGIPRNIFRAMIKQESGWNPLARSGQDAVGLVQIHLPSHPDVTREQAQNPAFALDWGARYLSSQYKAFGKWNLALAAYNAGPGRVKNGAWTSIPETTSYVKNVLGMAGTVKSGAVPVGGQGSGVLPSPAAPVTSTAPTVDLSGNMLEGLADIASGHFDPVQQFSRVALSRHQQADMALDQARMLPPPVSLPSADTPVVTTPGKPTAGYSSMKLGKIIGTPGAGTHTVGNWQSDNAWDIAIPVGTPIRADASGVIGDRIGYLGDPNDKGRFGGQRINLQGRKNAYYYAHLSKIIVKAGQRVRKGQIIGYSGEANGVAHLHFGVQHI